MALPPARKHMHVIIIKVFNQLLQPPIGPRGLAGQAHSKSWPVHSSATARRAADRRVRPLVGSMGCRNWGPVLGMLLLAAPALGFYLPGVAPQDYAKVGGMPLLSPTWLSLAMGAAEWGGNRARRATR